MPNLLAALKHEIARLARREARSLTRSLARNSAQFRRDIAELKRQNSKAGLEIARLQRQMRQTSVAPLAQASDRKPRFSAASVKSQRRRLGVSAADYATLVGVTAHTIYQWEHGASKPRRAQLAALAAVRGLGKTEVRRRLQASAATASRARGKKG
jgi:DNA-binding transcriptional regulator YiaG